MELGQRIKSCRTAAGLSQEQLAERMDIRRQAVTKWEAGQSAPSTENLFKLAEIFGTTVDLLLSPREDPTSSATEQRLEIVRKEQQQKEDETRLQRRRNHLTALLVALAYLTLYLIGRLIWIPTENATVLGWLYQSRPTGSGSYLYGWLLSSRLFWCAMAVSVLPALFGNRRFSVTALTFFLIGFLTGMIFGPNPGSPYGNTHYGWAIWGSTFLLSLILGGVLETLHRKGHRLCSPAGFRWLLAAIGVVLFSILWVRFSI